LNRHMDTQALLDDCNRIVALFNQGDRDAAGRAAEAWSATYLAVPPIPAEFHEAAHVVAEIASHTGRKDVVDGILQRTFDPDIDLAIRKDCNALIGLMNAGRYDEAAGALQRHVAQYWSGERLLSGSYELVRLLRFNAISLGLHNLLPALDRAFYRMKLFGAPHAHKTGAQALLIPGLRPIEMLSEGDCHICDELDCGGVFEPASLEVWAALAREADIVADVGANVGIYALVAAAANVAASVHAFEALPEAADRLEQNVAHNGLSNVVLHRTAVSDSAGTTAFKYLPVKPGGHICRVGAIDESRAGFRSIEVPKAPLDEAIPVAAGSRLLAKIDTEGHEARVIDGAAGWIDAGPVDFIIESFDPGQCAHIAGRLTPFGYRYYRILEGDHRLQPLETFTAAQNRARHDFNTLCTARNADELRALLPAHCVIAS